MPRTPLATALNMNARDLQEIGDGRIAKPCPGIPVEIVHFCLHFISTS
jgi:hypothetical protein